MPSSTKPAWLQADRKQNKSDIIWVYTFFTHLFKMLKSLLDMPMHGTSSKYGIPSDQISRYHLVEDFPSILNAPACCIHVNQNIPHKDIQLTTILNELLMSKPALFKGNYASTCIQNPYKSNRIWAPALSCCFCRSSSTAFCSCPHFICPNIMTV